MSHHADQVASVIQRTLQEIISRGLHDPRVRGLVSVTGVRLSEDMSEAVVGISVIPEEHADLTLKGLRHAATHLQSQVGKQASLRRLPRLVFKLDASLKRQADVLAAINRGRRRDAEDGVTDPAEEIPR